MTDTPWDEQSLAAHIGRYVSTTRDRTPLEQAVYGGPGTEGGGGLLVAVRTAPAAIRDGSGAAEDYGPVPWVEVDWGMSWAILPGTRVEFSDTDPFAGPAAAP